MKDVEQRDNAVAKVAIDSKNRMQHLFATGMFNLLQRSFLVISNQADTLVSLSKAAEIALESQEAKAVASPKEFRDLSEFLGTLKLLRTFLRQKLWKFQSNYASMVAALPKVMVFGF